jgi:anti-anti-sigma factor
MDQVDLAQSAHTMETKTQQIGDVTVVEMSGRLHLGNSLTYAENAVNRLIEGGTRKLVIDLAKLDYIDSSGLGMLIFCGGRMEASGGRMRVAGAAGGVARVFEIAHASRVLQFDPDLESACRNLSADAAAG